MDSSADEFLNDWAGVKLAASDRAFASSVEDELVHRDLGEIAHIIAALRWHMCNFNQPKSG